MTREEFLQCVNKCVFSNKCAGLKFPATERAATNTITDSEWEVIQHVYNFHPSIDEVFGKDQIAYLYVNFGWAIIVDMKSRADLMAEKENEYLKVKSRLDQIKEDMGFIRKGGIPF